MLLAFDPGETTGWALFKDDGVFLGFGQVKYGEELYTSLDGFTDINTVVIEKFTLYKHKAKQQSGSEMKTSQVIGIIKTYARNWGAEVVEQPASIKPIAEKFSGLQASKGSHKNSHHKDAFNHAIYYFISKGILKNRILDE